ncbi:MAG: cation:proton antiporter [Candidatus Omnitrophica bacterium]|nr:cation:proton antiporter [Candidatus Omnitrophota bacterium]
MRVRWFIGLAAIALVLLAIFALNIPILFHYKLPHVSFFKQCFFVLLLSALLCLYRVLRGPTAADRIISIDILGILIVGFCVIIGIPTGRSWYIDIGIAWALQSFVSTLALAKYLEGKDLDE